MNMSKAFLSPLLIVTLFGATACTQEARQAATEAGETIKAATAETGDAAKAIAEAREKLKQENLTLGRDGQGPKAELTPTGDLLIDGRAVSMTQEQRGAALAYRTELLAIADAGLVMGQQGVELAGEAMSQVVAGLFNGDAEKAGAQIEAKGQEIAAAGLALCERLQGFEATQERFASLVPEFTPYAKAVEINADCESATEKLEAAATSTAAPSGT